MEVHLQLAPQPEGTVFQERRPSGRFEFLQDSIKQCSLLRGCTNLGEKKRKTKKGGSREKEATNRKWEGEKDGKKKGRTKEKWA